MHRSPGRILSFWVALGLFHLCAGEASSATKLLAVRTNHYPEEKKTRIVFDCSDRREFTVSTRALNTIVTFKDTPVPEPKWLRFGEGLVDEVRFEKVGDDVAAVLTLSRSAASCRHYYLAPTKEFPNHRVVLDFLAGSGAVTQKKCVILDPGHGGWNDGCRGRGKNYSLVEREIVLDVAKRVEKLFNERDRTGSTDVFLTRTGDYLPFASKGKPDQEPKSDKSRLQNRRESLNGRVAYAEGKSGRYGRENSVFISIHANWASVSRVHGYEVYVANSSAYSSGKLRLLREREDAGEESADKISPRVADAIRSRAGKSSRRLATGLAHWMDQLPGMTYHGGDKGLDDANFVVLRTLAMPAVLLEVGFLSNSAEAARFRSTAFRQRVAESIYNAIVEYLRVADARYPLRTIPMEVSYTVKKGDNLTGIASAHGVTAASLMAANQLGSSKITPGMVLRIPR
jgi:N-acetylmuramoyl-L-alanine amidase